VSATTPETVTEIFCPLSPIPSDAVPVSATTPETVTEIFCPLSPIPSDAVPVSATTPETVTEIFCPLSPIPFPLIKDKTPTWATLKFHPSPSLSSYTESLGPPAL
jgi:hypothetical protein